MGKTKHYVQTSFVKNSEILITALTLYNGTALEASILGLPSHSISSP